jgi:hypothetical protein
MYQPLKTRARVSTRRKFFFSSSIHKTRRLFDKTDICLELYLRNIASFYELFELSDSINKVVLVWLVEASHGFFSKNIP